MRSSVVIATTAKFLIDGLREKLHDVDLKVYVAANDNELREKILHYYPRYIFLENCFHEYGTDEFIQDINEISHGLHIVIWTASKIVPMVAARFIHAGAESYFSLRDSTENIEKILTRIARGEIYYPADVDEALDRECSIPTHGVPFTKREREIIKLSIPKNSNTDIANILGVTIHTVKFHKANIYRKCGGNSNHDILGKGLHRGIITPDDLISRE